jgi:hypothetical protein
MVFRTWFLGLGISTLGPGFSHSRIPKSKPENFLGRDFHDLTRQFRVLIRRGNRPGQSDSSTLNLPTESARADGRTNGQSVGRIDFRGGARVLFFHFSKTN